MLYRLYTILVYPRNLKVHLRRFIWRGILHVEAPRMGWMGWGGVDCGYRRELHRWLFWTVDLLENKLGQKTAKKGKWTFLWHLLLNIKPFKAQNHLAAMCDSNDISMAQIIFTQGLIRSKFTSTWNLLVSKYRQMSLFYTLGPGGLTIHDHALRMMWKAETENFAK